jgi:hypothetical protein
MLQREPTDLYLFDQYSVMVKQEVFGISPEFTCQPGVNMTFDMLSLLA